MARYSHLDDTYRAFVSGRRGVHMRLSFAVQLGSVRFLGTFLGQLAAKLTRTRHRRTSPDIGLRFAADAVGELAVDGLFTASLAPLNLAFGLEHGRPQHSDTRCAESGNFANGINNEPHVRFGAILFQEGLDPRDASVFWICVGADNLFNVAAPSKSTQTEL